MTFNLNKHHFLLKLFLIVIIITMVTGCAAFSEKFTKTKAVNLTPFADQTIAMLGNMEYGFEGGKAVYLKEYAIPDDPDVQKIRRLQEQINNLIRGIIAYSIEIVTLSESKMPKEEKAKQLADFVETLEKPVITQTEIKIRVTREEFEEILANIRAQEKLLDGLAAAQPLINEVARYGGEILNELRIMQGIIERRADRLVDEQNEHLLKLVATLRDQQKMAIQGIQFVHEYMTGDDTAMDRLHSLEDKGLKEMLASITPTTKNMRKIEQYFIEQLDRTEKVTNQVDLSIKLYREAHKELDRLVAEHEADIRRSRLIIIVWSRAHHRMASGVMNPAKWFDVSEGAGELFKAGKKLVF